MENHKRGNKISAAGAFYNIKWTQYHVFFFMGTTQFSWKNIKEVTTFPPQALFITSVLKICYLWKILFMKKHKRDNDMSAAGVFYKQKCTRNQIWSLSWKYCVIKKSFCRHIKIQDETQNNYNQGSRLLSMRYTHVLCTCTFDPLIRTYTYMCMGSWLEPGVRDWWLRGCQ